MGSLSSGMQKAGQKKNGEGWWEHARDMVGNMNRFDRNLWGKWTGIMVFCIYFLSLVC